MWVLFLSIIVGGTQIGEQQVRYQTEQDCRVAFGSVEAIAEGMSSIGLRWEVRGKCVREEQA